MMVDFPGGSSRRKPDRVKICFESGTDRIHHRAQCGGGRGKRRDQELLKYERGVHGRATYRLTGENQRFDLGC